MGDELGRRLGTLLGDDLGRSLGDVDGCMVTEGLPLGDSVLHAICWDLLSSACMTFKVSSANPESKIFFFTPPETTISFSTDIKSEVNVLSCGPCNIISASMSKFTK